MANELVKFDDIDASIDVTSVENRHVGVTSDKINLGWVEGSKWMVLVVRGFDLNGFKV